MLVPAHYRGAGFIGANLERMALEGGYKVSVLDNLSEGLRDSLAGLPIEFVEGDIQDRWSQQTGQRNRFAGQVPCLTKVAPQDSRA